MGPHHRERHRPSALERVRLQLRGWGLGSQVALTGLLVAMTVLASTGMLVARPWVPPSTYILIELLGAFLLRLRAMVVLCIAIVGQFLGIGLTHPGTFTPGTYLLQAIAIVALLAFAAHRERLGLQGAPGDLMLVDLRDRLGAHGRIPALPPGWRVDTALRSAHAEAFSGDFLVVTAGRRTDELQLVLVDVSGKGQDAGVRSLQLSGALSGLLGSMPPEGFLLAANTYLLGQDWDEGFATAVHLTVRLDTGAYTIASAGHLPPVHLHAGSGVVELLDTLGSPALGVVEAPTFRQLAGELAHGDVLVLYTDGLVEVPGGDLELGIDRLMGATERLIATRRGGAEAVLVEIGASEGDDRALVLVSRD